MLRRKFNQVRSDPRKLGRYQAGNPLWPLEELHDLDKPPFVADPEFTAFKIDALPQGDPALPGDAMQVRASKHRRSRIFQREYPIPELVAGLPWRFVPHVARPIVPEVEFAPLDLLYIKR